MTRQELLAIVAALVYAGRFAYPDDSDCSPEDCVAMAQELIAEARRAEPS